MLKKGHIVKVVQILDADEKNMPFEGDFKLIDSETNILLRTFISRRGQLDYVERLKNHAEKIDSICSDYGIKFYQFNTSIPIFDSFFDLASS